MVDIRNRSETLAYIAALEEMVVRLACSFRRRDIDRVRALGTFRKEILEGAFRSIQQTSETGRSLDKISQLIAELAKAKEPELAAIEARYRARNNPGVLPHG